MTSIGLTESDIDRVSTQVCEKLMNSLPDSILQIIKGSLPELLEENIPTFASKLDEHQKLSSRAKSDANEYIYNNNTITNFLNKQFNIRKQKYRQFIRCKNLLSLYDECMLEDPPYVPKKFRGDKYHVRNQREQEIIFNRNMSQMKSEYELLSFRRDDFEGIYKSCDEEIRKHVAQAPVNQFVRDEILNIWVTDCKAEEDNVNNEWIEKVKGMKESFMKDKSNLQKDPPFQNNPNIDTIEVNGEVAIHSQPYESPLEEVNDDGNHNSTDQTEGTTSSSSTNSNNTNTAPNQVSIATQINSLPNTLNESPEVIEAENNPPHSQVVLAENTFDIVDFGDDFDDFSDNEEHSATVRAMARNFHTPLFRGSDSRDIPPKPAVRRSSRIQGISVQETREKPPPQDSSRRSYPAQSQKLSTRSRYREDDWRNSTEGRLNHRRNRSLSPQDQRRTHQRSLSPQDRRRTHQRESGRKF